MSKCSRQPAGGDCARFYSAETVREALNYSGVAPHRVAARKYSVNP